ncbi:MAG TPA: DUF3750 domain-containing protein [Gammaproteobacteria bacterium]
MRSIFVSDMTRARATWLCAVPALLFGLAYVDKEQDASGGDWRTASRAPVGLAPDPLAVPDPVVQVYAARAVRWRGYFGVHTWVAVKPRGAPSYTVYEVNGWRMRRTGTSVAIGNRPPDSRWFGNAPELIAELRGDAAAAAIEKVEAAVASYPYADRYHVWPGPNSNTFTAHVLRAVPELRADLPPTAIGKDYLGAKLIARSPSGSGFQLNLFGVLGILVGVEEGLELNVLGLTFGVDPLDLAVKLPLAGRIGWPEEVSIATEANADD